MALRKAIGKQRLNETDFVTLLHEVEAVISERPITYVDSDSITVIRPIDFLDPEVSLSCDLGATDAFKEKQALQPTSRGILIPQWKESQQCLNSFWSL